MSNTQSSQVFQQLETEMRETDEKVEKLNSAVNAFVKLNGAGDGVRKRLRSALQECFSCGTKTAKAIQ